MTPRWTRGRTSDRGSVLLDVLLAAVLAMLLTVMAVPFTVQAADAAKARNAAGYLAGQIRATRHKAVSGNRASALVFDWRGDDWTFRICTDGNGNGVRRADITRGHDSCTPASNVLSHLFPGVRLWLDPLVPGVEEAAGRSDGVRFGTATMASCSPLGNCSPGTLYVRSTRGQQYAVRVAGVAGRTRILRFDTGSRSWLW